MGDLENYWIYRDWWNQHNELASLLSQGNQSSNEIVGLLREQNSSIESGFQKLDYRLGSVESLIETFISEYRGDQRVKAELDRQRYEFQIYWLSLTVEERKEFLEARERRAAFEVRASKLKHRKETVRQALLTEENEKFQKRWLRQQARKNKVSPEKLAVERAEAEARRLEQEKNIEKKNLKREAREQRLRDLDKERSDWVAKNIKIQMANRTFTFCAFLLQGSGLALWWLVSQQQPLIFIMLILPIVLTYFLISKWIRRIAGRFQAIINNEFMASGLFDNQSMRLHIPELNVKFPYLNVKKGV